MDGGGADGGGGRHEERQRRQPHDHVGRLGEGGREVSFVG